jgi:PAS domain S-box-containing protein
MLFQSSSKNKIQELSQKVEQLENEVSFATQYIQNITLGKTQNIDLNNLFQNELSQTLLDMQKKLDEVKKNEEARSWAMTGLAKFADILRNQQDDIKTLSNQIISNLVKYLQASQGGIFFLNHEMPEDQFLELIACYAYDRTKFINKKVLVNADGAEGLLGQAFWEKESIYLEQVPDNYVHISTGLGTSNPRSILMVPLLAHEQVHGVIEIASFHKFEKYQIEFVEKLAESIAITISTVQINQRNRRLLEDFQNQTEELRAQEEELRQNNEELLATQEEMRRRGNELDGQLNSINNSAILKVEFSPEGVIESINPTFCKVMNYTEEEIIQKPHQSLVHPKTFESAEYTQFWKSLQEGNVQTGEYQYISKDGMEVWLNATYCPVLDTHSHVYKVILLSFDVTESKKQFDEITAQTNRLLLQEQVMLKRQDQFKKMKTDLVEKNKEIEDLKAQLAQIQPSPSVTNGVH